MDNLLTSSVIVSNRSWRWQTTLCWKATTRTRLWSRWGLSATEVSSVLIVLYCESSSSKLLLRCVITIKLSRTNKGKHCALYTYMKNIVVNTICIVRVLSWFKIKTHFNWPLGRGTLDTSTSVLDTVEIVTGVHIGEEIWQDKKSRRETAG